MAQSAESFQVKVKKFDPDLHGNNLYDAFQEFVDSFHYEYEVVAKQPAATLTDEEKAAWVSYRTNKRCFWEGMRRGPCSVISRTRS